VQSDIECLPQFFAVGPPRTATTWLHRVLRAHVTLPKSVKETRFFDLRYAQGMRWYAAHFAHGAPGRLAGEIAPTYFHSDDARTRIAKMLPDAKIICTFRDPSERLYSLYKLKRASGKLACSFQDAVRSDPEMVQSSRYVHYLARWRAAFGPGRVLVLIYEDLHRDPDAFVRKVCEFIGIDPIGLDAAMREPVNSTDGVAIPAHPAWTRLGISASEWMRSHRYDRTMAVVRKLGLLRLFLSARPTPTPPPDPMQVAELRLRLRSEIEQLEEVLGIELPDWKRTGA